MGHNLAVGLIVDLHLWQSDSNFRLVGDHCRSFIFGSDNQEEPMNLGTGGHNRRAPATISKDDAPRGHSANVGRSSAEPS
jgi:hypothetical protein